jgi:hypothetical protein
MGTDETQIKAGEKDFSLQPVTQHLIGAAFEVHNILGFGFLEKVYQRVLQVELQLRGVKVELEPKIQVQFKTSSWVTMPPICWLKEKSSWN